MSPDSLSRQSLVFLSNPWICCYNWLVHHRSGWAGTGPARGVGLPSCGCAAVGLRAGSECPIQKRRQLREAGGADGREDDHAFLPNEPGARGGGYSPPAEGAGGQSRLRFLPNEPGARGDGYSPPAEDAGGQSPFRAALEFYRTNPTAAEVTSIALGNG